MSKLNPESMAEVLEEVCSKNFSKGRLQISKENFIKVTGYKRIPRNYIEDTSAFLLEEHNIFMFELDEAVVLMKYNAVMKSHKVTKSKLKKYF